MKKKCIIFAGLSVFILFAMFAQAELNSNNQVGLYGRQIVHPDTSPKVLEVSSSATRILKESFLDAQDILGRMTGENFTEITGGDDQDGIVLTRLSDARLPADILAKFGKKLQDNPQAFLIWSATPSKLMIVASGDLGLSYGLYYYLEKLGCRWYLPGDNFSIIPKRNDINIKIEELLTPEFRMRTYFGQGGLGINTVVDNPNSPNGMGKRQNNWYRRNRWGGEGSAGGHDWDGFIERNRAVFEQHPEYLAYKDGKRQPLYANTDKAFSGTKLCVSNPELIKLYIADRVKYLNNPRQGNIAPVEASDGGRFCQCENCMKIGNGSESDQCFYLANEVAKGVAAALPGRSVGCLAYAGHANLPSFELEPNVMVQVAPGAFQNTRYAPIEIMEAWGEKLHHTNLGIYDYWNLVQSKRDMPELDYLRKPKESLSRWKKQGISAFTLESSTGGGATGLALYLTSKLAWDLNADTDLLLKEFYSRCFGSAALPMKRLLERWSTSFELIPEVLGTSFIDMNEAIKLADKDPEDVRQRVNDYANYLQYIRLYYEYRARPKGDAERSRKAREAVKLMWRIYHSSMMQTFYLQWMIRLHDERDEPWINDFDMRNMSQPGWEEVQKEGPVSHAETLAWIEQGVKDFGAKANETRVFSNDLVPLTSWKTPKTIDFNPPLQFATAGYTRFAIWVPEGMNEVKIKAHSLLANNRKFGENKPPIRIRWFKGLDNTGKSLYEAEMEISENMKEYTMPAPIAGLYELDFLSMMSLIFEVELPQLPIAILKMTPYTEKPMKLYFYVPKNTAAFNIMKGAAPGGNYKLRVTKPDGSEAEYEQSNKNYSFHAEKGEDGVWCLENYRLGGSILRFRNIPQGVGISPDLILVPKETIQPQ